MIKSKGYYETIQEMGRRIRDTRWYIEAKKE